MMYDRYGDKVKFNTYTVTISAKSIKVPQYGDEPADSVAQELEFEVEAEDQNSATYAIQSVMQKIIDNRTKFLKFLELL